MPGKKPAYRVIADSVSVRKCAPGSGPSHPHYNDFISWAKGDLMRDYPDYTNIASLLQKGAIAPVGKPKPEDPSRPRLAAAGEPDIPEEIEMPEIEQEPEPEVIPEQEEEEPAEEPVSELEEEPESAPEEEPDPAPEEGD